MQKPIRLIIFLIVSGMLFSSAFCFAADSSGIAVAEKTYAFHYNRQGKIDPFKPVIQKETLETKKRSDAFMSPLQEYSIEQLRLLGIMSGEDKTVAIVSDPKGKSYVIFKGTWIGQNQGRVAEIRDDHVIVEEKQARTAIK
jgi:type IV pilus assembly protein PilP